MVAGSYNYNSFAFGGVDIFYARIRRRAVYIHAILTGVRVRRAIIIFLVFIVICSLFAIRNNNNPGIIISQLLKKGDIKPGELIYAINLLSLLPVGEAVFLPQKEDEYQGQKAFHLSAKAKSLSIYSKFLAAQANVDSYLDKDSLNPVVFRQRLSMQGKKDIVKDIFYDQQKHIMSIDGIRRQILPDTQDPLSAIYHIRNMDFAQNKEFSLSINTNQKNYVLSGTSELKTVSINKKTYKLVLIKASIARRDKNPYHKSQISMILLQEKENIPIVMRVFASGILINIRLTEIK